MVTSELCGSCLRIMSADELGGRFCDLVRSLTAVGVDAVSLNVASLMAALFAVAISSWLAMRQSAIMRHANEVPLLTETFKEYRSPAFQRNEHYVVTKLAEENPPELGISCLPEEARIAATSLITFFNIMGSVLVFNMIDEALVVPLLGYRANQDWMALEPYILTERRRRAHDAFASYFEDFVCRCRDHQPPMQAYGVRLRQLPPERL
jgi:hypothetical protein